MQYVSVIGTGVKGSLLGKDTEEKRGVADAIQSLVAYSSYLVLSGEGEGILGDGEYNAIQLSCLFEAQHTRAESIIPYHILSYAILSNPLLYRCLTSDIVFLAPFRDHSSAVRRAGRSRRHPAGGE